MGIWQLSKAAIIMHNTASQLITRLIGTGATFLITLMIARSYGLVLYGDFTKITTFVALFYILTDFGMNAVYLQKSREQEPDGVHWQSLLGTRIILSLVLLFLCTGLLVFLPTGVGRGYTAFVKFGILLYSLTILFHGIITSANAYFQKKLRYELATLAVAAGSVVSVILVYLGTYIFLPPAGLLFSVISLAIGALISAACSAALVRGQVQTLIPHLTVSRILPLLRDSLPLALTLVFNLVYFRIDILILTITRSTVEVGVYGLAYKFFEFALVIPTFFMNSLYPILLGAVGRESDAGAGEIKLQPEFVRMIRNAGLALLIFSMVVLVIYMTMAPYLTLINRQFSESVRALRILSLSLPLFFLSSLGMWVLVTLRRQRLLVGIYFSAMLINIVLNLIFIPSHGYIAAAVITGVTEVVVLVSSFWVIFNLLRFPKRRESA
ncbi:hypothetical protein A2154_00755 [Candidatus Gottesmanbacteria bacterium RBG_16_43_7]|uniref:Uncharacterized protein n=1 Tax=Candidatus Gottesmanbacteria bacterium RBG_16_43_7 TaxID=1798373 RepID=A0A1F5Z8H8_9BACT|nr:MAG: hypothetical protein A2154_00755 [Candidatus Gottesmanbacteria bacterium RBG_16_43_7]